MAVTMRGLTLADRIGRYVERSPELAEICSRIARQAAAYNTIQEHWTSTEMTDAQVARMERRETRIEQRIAELVATLPPRTDGGSWQIRFSGDPRGYVVTLTGPDGWDLGIA